VRYLVVFRDIASGDLELVKVKAADRIKAVELAVARLERKYPGREEWDQFEVKRVVRTES
jgi:hypothetical protein